MFHYTALISLVSILLGMVPIWMRKTIRNWKYLHFSFMYWSIIGLYAAFAAEVLVRIPKTPFFGMVGIATGVIMVLGGIGFGIKNAKWKSVFGG